ncbi:MAG: hypothetical protein GY796_19880 [Chloroflexi bacterium]|nr:hypothetical protein [Chloroflexota bacterium]
MRFFSDGRAQTQQLTFRRGLAVLLNNQATLTAYEGLFTAAKETLQAARLLTQELEDSKISHMIRANQQKLHRLQTNQTQE